MVLEVSRRGRVLEITLDRPPVNAINVQLSRELHAALNQLQEEEELRCGLLTGQGDHIFSAGWDLKELAGATDPKAASAESINLPGGFAGIVEHWRLKKPIVAALNGHAVGGGLEVAIACDVILAADHVELFLPEMQRGFLADAGAVQRLPRLLPYNVAMEMMLTGRRMSAHEAKGWGLVHEVVSSEHLLDRTRELADQIAEGAPLALQALKEVVGPMRDMSLPDAFAATRTAVTTESPGEGSFPTYERMLASDDFLEGAHAFAEKRDPDFSGD